MGVSGTDAGTREVTRPALWARKNLWGGGYFWACWERAHSATIFGQQVQTLRRFSIATAYQRERERNR